METASMASQTNSPDALTMLSPGQPLSSSSSLLSVSSILSSVQQETPVSTPDTGSENGDPAPSPTDAAKDAAFDRLREQLPPSTKDEFILVTGGLGYIGSHTALELLKAGYNVIIVDNLINCFASKQWSIRYLAGQYRKAQGLPTPKLHFHELDYQSTAMKVVLEQYCSSPYGDYPATEITSPEVLIDPNNSSDGAATGSRSQISGVIHFAAHKSVEDSIHDPLGYYDNNVCGLVGFIRLLAEFNIRNFVFSSSATVYGSKANAEKPLCEDDLVHHPTQVAASSPGDDTLIEPNVQGLTCPYARTKYFCEAILADVSRSDPQWRIVVLRYFNPIGCDPSGLLGEMPRGKRTNLFPVVAQVLSGELPALSVFGRDWPTPDGTAIRDYIHVTDIARGHIAALCRQETGEPFRTYNLGSGTGTSVLEIVTSLEAASRRPVPIKWTGRRAGDVGFCIASPTRAAKELGWTPRESIAQSARDLWNQVRKMHKIPRERTKTGHHLVGSAGYHTMAVGPETSKSENQIQV